MKRHEVVGLSTGGWAFDDTNNQDEFESVELTNPPDRSASSPSKDDRRRWTRCQSRWCNAVAAIALVVLSMLGLLSYLAYPRHSSAHSHHHRRSLETIDEQPIDWDAYQLPPDQIMVEEPSNSMSADTTRPKIAICVCVKSTPAFRDVARTALQQHLIRGVTRTVTAAEQSQYDFELFLGLDEGDPFFTPTRLSQLLLPDWLPLNYSYYKKATKHRIPFNELIRYAASDPATTYFARLNDDSEIVSQGWVSLAVGELAKLDNVGVIGPTCTEGNTFILTHDFVHRTHLEIFDGNYYSPEFDNWYIDDWITKIYLPNRAIKLKSWHVDHHVHHHGTRYAANTAQETRLKQEIQAGKNKIAAYIQSHREERLSIEMDHCVMQPASFKSQSNEDKALYNMFFKNPLKCKGVIVEIGALDGLTYSNSFFFEKALQWKSVLVEANPANAINLAQNRPNAITIHAAICSGKETAFIGSGAVGGVVDSMSLHHRNGWIPKNEKAIAVPCTDWHTIFTTHNIFHIDIFVIDVEGGEYGVLSLMDWNVSVDVWVIETSESSTDDNLKKIVSILDDNGYEQSLIDLKKWCSPDADCTSNTVFTRKKNNYAGKEQSEESGQVISFSLYGNDPRYIDGALENSRLLSTFFPGWTMRVYYDGSVPLTILEQLRKNNNVELVDAGKMFPHLAPMTWRFLVASDARVTRYIIRDIDSRLSARDAAAVQEWIREKTRFHVVRDHPSHSSYAMSGGLWGGTRDAVPNMARLLKERRVGRQYIADMDFLNKVIWPIARRSVTQHDALGCHSSKYGTTRAFPTPRIGLEHIGSVWIDGRMRQVDTDILKNALNNECKNSHVQIGKTMITNKRYISFCDAAFKTRSRDDLQLPLPPHSVVCVRGDRDVLDAFFKLDIRAPFTLVTIESDEAVPQNPAWLKNPYLVQWYGWNSAHPGVQPIPIGLNHDSQLLPLTKASIATIKVAKLLVNFKHDRPERVALYNKMMRLDWVHVEPYEKKWMSPDRLTNHYERISQFKWTLCPRGAGQDTHRLWEALYLGSIPVVLKSTLSQLYADLPVIQLDSWDELSLETLERLTMALTNDRHKAYFDYWAKVMKHTISHPNYCNRFLVGIFSTRRDNVLEDKRRSWMPFHTIGAPLKCGVSFIFVHGADGTSSNDTVRLQSRENMNRGKSFEWFKTANTLFPDANYVFKMDMDTGHCPETLVQLLNSAARSKADYIGWKHNFHTCGKWSHCPPVGANWGYMAGAFYGLSRLAVQNLGKAITTKSGFEDLMIGKTLFSVMRPRTFDVDCLFIRDKGAVGYNQDNQDSDCPIRHFQDAKQTPLDGPICKRAIMSLKYVGELGNNLFQLAWPQIFSKNADDVLEHNTTDSILQSLHKINGFDYLSEQQWKSMVCEYALEVRGVLSHPNAKVLEVGCGTGAFLQTIRACFEETPDSVEYYGVDLAASSIRIATRFVKGNFFVANSTNLDIFKEKTFDLVLSNSMFEYLGTIDVMRQTLAELSRVVKDEGIVAIFDISDAKKHQLALHMRKNHRAGQAHKQVKSAPNHLYLTKDDIERAGFAAGLRLVVHKEESTMNLSSFYSPAAYRFTVVFDKPSRQQYFYNGDFKHFKNDCLPAPTHPFHSAWDLENTTNMRKTYLKSCPMPQFGSIRRMGNKSVLTARCIDGTRPMFSYNRNAKETLWRNVGETGTELSQDWVFVKCKTALQLLFFPRPLPQPKIPLFNVLLIQIDALSNGAMHRFYPTTERLFRENQPFTTAEVFSFARHNPVGYNSPPNMRAIYCAQKSCSGKNGVINHFKAAGYTSIFLEDYWGRYPDVGEQFTSRILTNDIMPQYGGDVVDLYHLNPIPGCKDGGWMGRRMMKYIRDSMFEGMDSTKGGFLAVANFLEAHNPDPLGGSLDQSITSFLTELDETGRLGNSIVMIYGDHGYHHANWPLHIQRFEQRNPALHVIIGKNVRHPSINRDAAAGNRDKLISSFDLNAAMINLADSSAPTLGTNFLGTALSETRTCKDARILPQWCNCWRFKPHNKTLTTPISIKEHKLFLDKPYL